MVTLVNTDLQQAVHCFETMIDALERYQVIVQTNRDRYRAEGRDPKGFERPVANSLKRIDQLREALDGEVYDLLRNVLDSTGILESVDKGEWI